MKMAGLLFTGIVAILLISGCTSIEEYDRAETYPDEGSSPGQGIAQEHIGAPARIPTKDMEYWNEHKNEYSTNDGVHYIHPGSNIDEIGRGWKQDYHLTVKGNTGDWIGWDMTGGTITVQGNVDDLVGGLMTGGIITVQGDVGDDVGELMKGGTITVQGNAEQGVGNEMEGGNITVLGEVGWNVGVSMQGGSITIQGNAGSYVGDHMQEGSITIKGNANNWIGVNMQQGSITIQGKTGWGLGYEMQGGTIIVNCENVADGAECTGDDIGNRMQHGKIYVKGKAGPLARWNEGPKGGEIWEYWGTSRQRRLYPAF